MKDPMISVIIPVYNAETYIAQTVGSILRQSYSDFELLLIVDGATDGSLAICNNLQEQDVRISVVDKKNEGVSATRNLGIALAKGKYICFVDADDRVTEEYLQKLFDAVTTSGAQMALCQYAFERNGEIIPSGEPEFAFYDRQHHDLYQSYICSIYRIAGAPYIMGSACRSIFERSLLQENNITFPNCKLFEDQLFLLTSMAYSERIGTVNEVMYFYNDAVTGSAIRNPYKKALLKDQQIYLAALEQVLPKLPITPQQRMIVYDYCVLNVRKLLLTNAAMHPDSTEGKKEIVQIRKSSVFDDKIPFGVYLQWLHSQPMKTAAAEVLIQLRLYGLLKKLRSR